MKNEINVKDFLIAVALAFTSGFFFGIGVGQYTGRNDACESVHAEWVKDKCMKVSREEVK